MTKTGKCETCRLRKVKCDEQKPVCSACLKGDRSCAYIFGKASSFVVEDPTRFSKHGRPQVAPLVYPIIPLDATDPEPSNLFHISSISPSSSNSSPKVTEAGLQITTKRSTDDGGGVFSTLAVVSKSNPNGVRKSSVQAAQRRKRLEIHLERLKKAASLMPHRITAPGMELISRYVSILEARPFEHQPLAILGSWTQTIPSRIGSSAHVDLAVEYLVDCFNFFQQENFTNHSKALGSKARALKGLQLAVSNENTRATYDTILAMRMHYVAEILSGIKNFYHAIHSAALNEILRKGPVAGLDEDHYWSFLDSTYIDDVTEATVVGRPSVFDTPLYLNTTSAASVPADATDFIRASTAIMHTFIQVPRLICLTRHAIEHPEDTTALTAAISLAESLWTLEPFDLVQQVIYDSATTYPTPPHAEIFDIIPDSYQFDSVPSAILVSRYWHLRVNLCGITEMLYLQFPTETEKSLLPDLGVVNRRDIDAAMDLARTIRYSLDTCPELPLLPLRLHTTFQISLGTWYRLVRRLTRRYEAVDNTIPESEVLDLAAQLSKAQRMEQFVIDEINRIQTSWKLQSVSKDFLLGAIEDMSGGKIPEWLPTSVKFECEDGNMVMKISYGLPLDIHEEMFGLNPNEWTRSTTTESPFDHLLSSIERHRISN